MTTENQNSAGMKPEKSPGFFDRIWNFFASIRLTVALLLTLAGTSIIGTLVPQNEDPASYFKAYGEFLYRLFYALDIFDMYRSWWFQFLLLMLVLNILVCSADRLISTGKIIFAKKPKYSLSRFQKRPDAKTFTAPAPPENLLDPFDKIVASKFGYRRVEKTENGYTIFAEKGRKSRLGVYVVHLSVLLLLAGGLTGSFFGFEGYVNIPEGDTVSQIRLRNTNQPLDLPFSVRCDDFSVSFYNTGAPEEFRSTLTIFENENPVFTEDIIVNDPLRYRGINLFQSSYGEMRSRDADSEEVVINFTSVESGMSYTRKMKIRETIDMPEGQGTFKLDRFIPSYTFMDMMNLGQVFIGVLTPAEAAKPVEVILPVQHPDFDKMIVRRGLRQGNFFISVGDVQKRYYTGLQVTKDPGVPLVYLGFLVMIGGIFITFLMSHQQVCVSVEGMGKEKNSRVLVSGFADRNRLGMTRKVEDLHAQLVEAAQKTA